MDRIPSYLVLFAVSVLFQIFLFNNLFISVYMSPLVYITFLVLLPIETPAVVLLLAGLLMGVVMDWTMGIAGLNTAVALFSAFSRRAVLNLSCGKESVREGGIPSEQRLRGGVFLRYVIFFVVLNHATFFLLEALSFAQFGAVLLRLLISSVVTVVFIVLASRLFVSKRLLRE
ncbi:MAG: rod shape-determining protein MreD [Alistipes sp.]